MEKESEENREKRQIEEGERTRWKERERGRKRERDQASSSNEIMEFSCQTELTPPPTNKKVTKSFHSFFNKKQHFF